MPLTIPILVGRLPRCGISGDVTYLNEVRFFFRSHGPSLVIFFFLIKAFHHDLSVFALGTYLPAKKKNADTDLSPTEEHKGSDKDPPSSVVSLHTVRQLYVAGSKAVSRPRETFPRWCARVCVCDWRLGCPRLASPASRKCVVLFQASSCLHTPPCSSSATMKIYAVNELVLPRQVHVGDRYGGGPLPRKEGRSHTDGKEDLVVAVVVLMA